MGFETYKGVLGDGLNAKKTLFQAPTPVADVEPQKHDEQENAVIFALKNFSIQ